jgi:hypothetical protein
LSKPIGTGYLEYKKVWIFTPLIFLN